MRLNLVNKFKNSFRVKVVLVSIFFMLAICFSLTVYYVHVQRQSQNDALIGRAQLLAGTLAHSAKVGIFSENTELLKDPIDGVVEHQEVIYAAVFNSSGRELLDKVKDRPGMHLTEDISRTEKIGNQLLSDLRKSKSPIFFSSHNFLQVWSAVLSTAAYTKEESLFFGEENSQRNTNVTGFVRIILSKEILNKQIYAFIYRAFLIALAATVAGSLVILLIINGITSPLKQLTQSLKTLGSEGVTESIPVKTEDEIGRLAKAFNEMSESLRERKAENLSLEAQLRQVQKLEALGTLAGGIAHDFNNVLSPIFGYTQMAMEEVPEDGEVYSNLQEVFSASKRARDLVKQILAFSRQAKSERVPLKVQSIVKEVLRLLKATLPTTITVTHRIDDDCGLILADPTDIHRTIMNLCTNAYHAMGDKGGVLTVTLEKFVLNEKDRSPSPNLSPGTYLKLSVSDTGMGMNEEIRQRIFDPYFTTKLPGEGTGMGLAVVHGVVRSYEGDVIVRSEPGKGATFQVFLPRFESQIDATETLGAEPVQGGNERILLVDDEVQIVLMMKQMLDQLGYRVTARTSSIEALEAFASRPDKFDIVITDQTMPNMTGDELAGEVMGIRNDVPVIICTGFSEKMTEERARKKGIRAFLFKPVIKQDIARAIRQVLDSKQN